jgi:hypothetical protein
MSYIAVLQGTLTWLPFIAANADDGDPRIGITFNQVDVVYKKSSQATFSLKSLLITDFRENGNGVYEIKFAASELDTIGSFLYIVNSNGTLPLPQIKQSIGQAVVQSSASYTPGTITIPTNVLTGNLVDLYGNALSGEIVSARLLEAPSILGTTPNRGGVGSQIVSAKTDASGFFALELVQGSVVDIVIPIINYRRSLTVPSNLSDRLFDIP